MMTSPDELGRVRLDIRAGGGTGVVPLQALIQMLEQTPGSVSIRPINHNVNGRHAITARIEAAEALVRCAKPDACALQFHLGCDNIRQMEGTEDNNRIPSLNR